MAPERTERGGGWLERGNRGREGEIIEEEEEEEDEMMMMMMMWGEVVVSS